MKITAEYLHRKWKSISYYDGGYIQVEVKHSLEWHVGYKEIDQKTLVIVSEKEPELLQTSKSIAVSKGPSHGREVGTFICAYANRAGQCL